MVGGPWELRTDMPTERTARVKPVLQTLFAFVHSLANNGTGAVAEQTFPVGAVGKGAYERSVVSAVAGPVNGPSSIPVR